MSTPYWGPDFDALAAFDPDIAGVLLDELGRLRGGLRLIASENFTSPVRELVTAQPACPEPSRAAG